jgi:2-alkenal reductase
VVGLSAGLAGGWIASTVDSDESPNGTAEAPPPDLQERIREAVDRVYPNVVMVIADLPDRQDEQGRTVQRRNVGSGVVVSQAGHILTNFHVINGAATITVVLSTGEQREATLIADDSPFSDLAVLGVSPQGLRQVAFGSSDALRPGDVVLAVAGGSGAFGGGNGVSFGVVTATRRALPRSGVIFEDLVQTDAAVNNGDSGGALVNLEGEFVGLLTTVVRESVTGTTVEGVAFAQSADSLRPIVANIVSTGRHPRPRIGIERPDEQHVEITPELAVQEQLPVTAGALIVAPAEGSPAVAAGVQAGDIVVGVNGVAVNLEQPFVNMLKLLPAGARVDLAILRGGQQLEISVAPPRE